MAWSSSACCYRLVRLRAISEELASSNLDPIAKIFLFALEYREKPEKKSV